MNKLRSYPPNVQPQSSSDSVQDAACFRLLGVFSKVPKKPDVTNLTWGPWVTPTDDVMSGRIEMYGKP